MAGKSCQWLKIWLKQSYCVLSTAEKAVAAQSNKYNKQFRQIQHHHTTITFLVSYWHSWMRQTMDHKYMYNTHRVTSLIHHTYK